MQLQVLQAIQLFEVFQQFLNLILVVHFLTLLIPREILNDFHEIWPCCSFSIIHFVINFSSLNRVPICYTCNTTTELKTRCHDECIAIASYSFADSTVSRLLRCL